MIHEFDFARVFMTGLMLSQIESKISERNKLTEKIPLSTLRAGRC